MLRQPSPGPAAPGRVFGEGLGPRRGTPCRCDCFSVTTHHGDARRPWPEMHVTRLSSGQLSRAGPRGTLPPARRRSDRAQQGANWRSRTAHQTSKGAGSLGHTALQAKERLNSPTESSQPWRSTPGGSDEQGRQRSRRNRLSPHADRATWQLIHHDHQADAGFEPPQHRFQR